MPTVTKQTRRGTRRKSNGVVDRIKPVHLQEKKDTINIYGVSGTGKTTLACTYPKPLLLIGCEDGTRSVHKMKGVDFIRVTSSSEVGEVVEHIREEGKYSTAVLDTATSMQALVLQEILGLEELPTQSSWGLASRDQYGQCALQTKELLRHILRLAEDNIAHAVVLAQERTFGAEGDGELIAPTVMSSLTGSTVGWLNPECDYIVQTFKREGIIKKKTKAGGKTIVREVSTGKIEYCLRTGPHPIYLTKFRLPRGMDLPEFVIDPSYEKLSELIGR